MFKPFIGNCIYCPRGVKSLITTKRFLCQNHLQEFKESQKSPEKLAKEKIIREAKYTKASNYKFKPRKVTGEKTLFDKIWSERLHNCEVCSRPIIRKKNEVDMFSHVLSKGADPVLRLDEDFILLMGNGKYPCCDCHGRWEHRTKEMRQIEMWKPVFLLLDEAKIKGHKLRKNKPLYENKNSQNTLASPMEQNQI